MTLSAHDLAVIEDMKKQLEEMTGEKAVHVFIDTRETLSNDFCVDCGDPRGVLSSGCPSHHE